jgi:dihydroneopterin aldolase
MQKIRLKGVRVVAYHGCLKEESLIGSDYEVNLCVGAKLGTSANTDDLNDTVDYVALNTIIKQEMAIRAKLLETVAVRIVKRIANELPRVKTIAISVAKVNPPIGGDVKSVAVEWKWKRKEKV